MFIVSKALLISSATVIVRARGAIWLKTLNTVLFNVCSTVTVECCVLYTYCVGIFGIFGMFMLCTEEGSSPVSWQLLRGGIWACMRCHCRCFVGFCDGDYYVSQLAYVMYYVVVKYVMLSKWKKSVLTKTSIKYTIYKN